MILLMDIAQASNGAITVNDLLDMTIPEINHIAKELNKRAAK
jgi:hypothetical protein